MKNVSIVNKDKCFSCRSCEQSCINQSILMSFSNEGFLYPEINEKTCINCGKCLKVCPAINVMKNKEYEKNFLGLRLKDSKKIKESSSGGVFAAIADFILLKDGFVYGAAFDSNLQLRHIRIDSKDELIKLKGSKYIVSDTSNTYSDIKEKLCTNPDVYLLYSGTPCQIAGLKSFLGKEYKNLFTVDLVCHGVPSQKLFNQYINWLEEKVGEKILYYGFRDKDIKGWTCTGKIKTSTKTKIINSALDPYYSAFMRGLTYRKSCYSCPFANIDNRPGNVSIGDFWGVEIQIPSFYSKNGVSCCIINDEKGKDLFYQIKEKFYIVETTKEKIYYENQNLKSPVKFKSKRDIIYKNIDNAEKLIALLKAPFLIRTKRFIISILPRTGIIKIKQIIKGKKR